MRENGVLLHGCTDGEDSRFPVTMVTTRCS